MSKLADDAIVILRQSQEAGNKAVLWPQESAELLAHIERLEAEKKKTQSALLAVVEQLGLRTNGHDAPGHSHLVPGIWDRDNGVLAGKPCAWCALWSEAKQLAQQAQREG